MPLQPKDTLQAISLKETVTVDNLISSGGQGEVYRVTVGGSEYALKWYYPNCSTPEQRKIIENVLQRVRARPNLAQDSRFVFPIDLVEDSQWKRFGYLMPLLIGKQFPSVNDMMIGKVKPPFSVRCEVAYQLADAFQKLHTSGMVYADISFKNIHFHPQTGEIRIIDNDNVALDGEEVMIAGTPKFKAPELVRGDLRTPTVATDKYALAIFLFYIFFQAHPLEGEKEANIIIFDLAAQRKLYGKEPVFIYDPNDLSNRPIPDFHDSAIFYWKLYPQWFKEVFVRAFTEGLNNANKRIEPSEWKRVFVQLKDHIVTSSSGAENFYDTQKVKKGEPLICWHTKKQITIPARLKLGTDVLVLNKGKQLFAHHLEKGKTFDFSTPLAEVIENPQKPGVFGLRNLSQTSWKVTNTEGATSEVPQGKAAALKGGNTIDFGGKTGVLSK